jgi:hypothetical protein
MMTDGMVGEEFYKWYNQPYASRHAPCYTAIMNLIRFVIRERAEKYVFTTYSCSVRACYERACGDFEIRWKDYNAAFNDTKEIP